MRQTSASRRHAILQPGAGVVAACGINVGLDGMGETSLGDLGLRENGDRQVRVLVVENDPALQRMLLNFFGENNIHTLERFDVGRAAPARDTEHGRFRFCVRLKGRQGTQQRRPMPARQHRLAEAPTAVIRHVTTVTQLPLAEIIL